MSVDEKRQTVDKLRREIEERKAAMSVRVSETNDAVREERLDREIDRLQAELRAMDEVPDPTPELSAPQVVERGDHDINFSGEVTKAELEEHAAALGIDGAHKMKKDDLIDAIRERTGVNVTEGS